MGLMIFVWLFSLITIPKESSPDIKFWIISINTIYLGVNPQDIDSLITEKIEQEIKNVEGIKKITSNSFVWVSNIVVELTNEADTNDVLVEIKDAVDKTKIPSDAQDPVVTEISSNNETMFNILLYSNKYPVDYLKEKAKNIKKNLDGKNEINRIDIWWWDEREIIILINKTKIEKLGISLSQIAQTLNSFNKNQPLGNHQIWKLSYDFRIDWEFTKLDDIKKTPISLWWGDFIYVENIAEISYKQKDDAIRSMWVYNNPGNNFVTLTVNKFLWENIFTSAKSAKKAIESELEKFEYEWIDYVYTMDMAELINKDYSDLATNGLMTLLLVFLVMFFFVWPKEWLIATITVPLAFFVTFFVLNQMWLSLNFLTNFSLIVCFGIAIDATVVVIQWAHEKIRQGFNPKTAVLLSVRDYKIPLIAGTMTTVVVFLPMMTLPGVMWKFLAYIPITIFITLLASLFISLTLNSALYYKLSKPKKHYQNISKEDKYILDEDKILLEEERKDKIEINTEKISWRDRILDRLGNWYTDRLWRVMKNPKTRIISIFSPILLLVLSFIFLSPKIWFTLFPSGDSQWMYLSIEWEKWLDQNVMFQSISGLDNILANIPELKNYYYTIDDNNVDITIELVDKDKRKRDSFEIEKELIASSQYLISKWLKVESKVAVGWPPTWKAIGIKLIANSNQKFSTLLTVAQDFENFLKKLKWTKNISTSSTPSPWQFVFNIDHNKLALLGITPANIMWELYFMTNEIWAGTFKWENDNYDIKVKYKDFQNWITPDDITNITIPTQNWPIMFGTVSNYEFEKAIDQISREDTKIVVKVESDLEQGFVSTDIESKLNDFANNYNYPDGISFEKWWENQENADLIQAMWVSFLIALFLIYAILLLQFNSYLQPAIILYSVLLWLLWANIWLRITWNSYSLAFMIWFIALTGIVVNNAIVLIDKINESVSRGKPLKEAIAETGKSRLAPVLSTALTTILWLYSVAHQDKFFAGLAYTIMFWLGVATIMTLLIIPAIYHDKDKIIHLLKRSLLSFALWIGLPLIGVWIITVVLLLFWIYIWKLSIFMPLIGVLFVWYIIWYLIYTILTEIKWKQTIINKKMWIHILMIDGSKLKKSTVIKRFVVKYWILIFPIILGGLFGFILSKIWNPSNIISWSVIWVLYLIYILYNIYLVWINNNNQLIHDKICKTKVIQDLIKNDE